MVVYQYILFFLNYKKKLYIYLYIYILLMYLYIYKFHLIISNQYIYNK